MLHAFGACHWHCQVLSTWQAGKTKHIQLEQSGRGYFIKGTNATFPSIQQFLDHYKIRKNAVEIASIMASALVSVPM